MHQVVWNMDHKLPSTLRWQMWWKREISPKSGTVSGYGNARPAYAWETLHSSWYTWRAWSNLWTSSRASEIGVFIVIPFHLSSGSTLAPGVVSTLKWWKLHHLPSNELCRHTIAPTLQISAGYSIQSPASPLVICTHSAVRHYSSFHLLA